MDEITGFPLISGHFRSFEQGEERVAGVEWGRRVRFWGRF